MKIERHETGPRMSKVVIHGDTVYLAGIVADSPKGKSTAEQTRRILSQIDSFLATAGTMPGYPRAIRQRGRPLRPEHHACPIALPPPSHAASSRASRFGTHEENPSLGRAEGRED
jgi:hypothetical protein